jgi:hypothetical protein
MRTITGTGEFTAGPIAHLREFRHDLVEARVHEIGELDFRDRLEAVHRHADRHPDDARFVQRGIDDPGGAESVGEPFRHAKDAAVFRDVFAEDDDARIGRHDIRSACGRAPAPW